MKCFPIPRVFPKFVDVLLLIYGDEFNEQNDWMKLKKRIKSQEGLCDDLRQDQP